MQKMELLVVPHAQSEMHKMRVLLVMRNLKCTLCASLQMRLMHNIMMSLPEGKWTLGTNERNKV